MNRTKSLFDDRDEGAEAAADARAEADARAGRVIGHDKVKRWLRSRESANPLARPFATKSNPNA